MMRRVLFLHVACVALVTGKIGRLFHKSRDGLNLIRLLETR